MRARDKRTSTENVRWKITEKPKGGQGVASTPLHPLYVGGLKCYFLKIMAKDMLVRAKTLKV